MNIIALREKKYWLALIMLFWMLFWGLNGLDKFFNGSFEPIIDDAVTQSVVINPSSGTIQSYVQPMHTVGLFGVNRNAKMIHFFSRIGVGERTALGVLYTIAVIEILISILFFIHLLMILLPKKSLTPLRVTRTFLLCFLLFTLFTAGDIVFGERIELWEHVTFMVMVLMSYQFALKLLEE